MIKKSKYEALIDNKNSIFAVLNTREKELLKRAHLNFEFSKGQIIFKEEDRPGGVFFLVEGKVKLFKKGVAEREQILNIVKASQMLGLRSVLADEDYIASAMALDDCAIGFVDRENFMKVIKSSSEMMLRLLKTVSIEAGFYKNRIISLTQKHIRGRLAESLVILKNNFGFDYDGITLNVYISREDLAAMANMTPSNAIRTLASFDKERIIELEGKKIKIINLPMLERVSVSG